MKAADLVLGQRYVVKHHYRESEFFTLVAMSTPTKALMAEELPTVKGDGSIETELRYVHVPIQSIVGPYTGPVEASKLPVLPGVADPTQQPSIEEQSEP